MPDDELLALAETNKLHEPAVLDAQLKRMMTDKKAAAFADNFAGQWLEVRNLDSISPDPKKFAAWTPDLKEELRTETRLFFQHVLSENRPISEFVDAKYTFLNEPLAKYYGIPGVKGPDFRKVDLATDQRGGVLTQGSVLAVSSYPNRTSPTIRGKYILNNLLGSPPPPAPLPMSRRWTIPRLAAMSRCASNWKRIAPIRSALRATPRWMCLASAWRITTPSASGARWTGNSPSM